MPSLAAAVIGFMVWLTGAAYPLAGYPAGMTTPAHLPLRVGYVPGVILTKWRRIWEERFPDTPLAITPVTEPDARGALLRGDVDACFVRLPVDVDGLHLIRLYDEQPVVWVAKARGSMVLAWAGFSVSGKCCRPQAGWGMGCWVAMKMSMPRWMASTRRRSFEPSA